MYVSGLKVKDDGGRNQRDFSIPVQLLESHWSNGVCGILVVLP